MAGEKHFEMSIPVPWSPQPMVVTAFSIVGVAVLAISGVAVFIAWRVIG